MMGDRKKTRYLGALVAVCALGAFAGTAVADDSAALATGPDAQQAVVEPASNDTESVPAADEGLGASADAPAALEADTESTEDSPEGETTTSGDSSEETTNETTTSVPTETNNDSEPEPGTTTNDVTTTIESGGDCSPEGLVFGTSLAVGTSSATATFSVRSGCAGVLVTLVSYSMPKAQYSFPQQFFASSDGMFAGGGTYSLTVALPDCFFQIDLIRGPAPGAITGSGQPSQGLLRAALSSPNKICETTTTTTTTTTPTTSTETTTTTPTTSTETTTTTTTPTTSTETTTTTPTTSTETTTTTPTTTTETTTPTTTESSSPTTGVAGTGTTKGNSSLLGDVAAAATLPFTGLSLALIAVIGLQMILIGIGIRLAARQRRGIDRQS